MRASSTAPRFSSRSRSIIHCPHFVAGTRFVAARPGEFRTEKRLPPAARVTTAAGGRSCPSVEAVREHAVLPADGFALRQLLHGPDHRQARRLEAGGCSGLLASPVVEAPLMLPHFHHRASFPRVYSSRPYHRARWPGRPRVAPLR